MRVTTNSYSNGLISQLNLLLSRQTRLQTQAASGQRVQSAEDDPAAARRVLDLQAEAGSVAQYQANVTRAQDQATAVYAAVKALKSVSDRAGEIATLADSLKSPEELAAYADEVGQLIKQAVQAADTKQNGSYLFAGTRTDQLPFAMTTDAEGRVTAVSYQGNESVAPIEIAQGVTVAAQPVGANTSGSGPRGLITDSASGADFFNHLISLQNHLLAGDTAAIAATDRSQLACDEDNLLSQVSQNGAVQSRLEAAASVLNDRTTALQSQVSHEADADLAQTLVQLNATQTAYQAALQTGGKLLGLSLMDYLT
jgi:flagellar hook-associated protein 3 FlgL